MSHRTTARVAATRWGRIARLVVLFLGVLPVVGVLPVLLSAPVAAQPNEAGTAAPASTRDSARAVDVVFVLDNSGSMRANDPDFLTRRAVTRFVGALADDPTVEGRMALVLFDEQATLVQPLVAVEELASQGRLERTLASLDFSGQRSDSPAGIERALYELRERGRPEARRAIVFLSDGRIDTGDPANDLEIGRWLREDLASESDESAIGIFGIAFTDGADYQLMQALARRTRARYYRAFAAGDLEAVVEDVLATLDESVPYDRASLEEPSTPPATAGPASTSTSAGGAAVDDVSPSARASDDAIALGPGPGLLGWIPLAVLLVGVGYLVARRRAKPTPTDAAAAPPAQLLDPGGVLGEAGSILPLARGRTTIGRDPKNDIVLPDDTISSEHALIEAHDGRYWLVDLRSTNGTRHGDQRIPPDERVPLKGGDHVRFADIDLMFVVEGYVPGGATVYLSSSTRPPSDWSVLAASTAAEDLSRQQPLDDAIASDDPNDEHDQHDEHGEEVDLDAHDGAPRGSGRDAPPSREILFAEQRERLDPAPVVDLDEQLGSAPQSDPRADWGDAAVAPDSVADSVADESLEVASAVERAESARTAIEQQDEQQEMQPSAPIPLPVRPSESSRPVALSPEADSEPAACDPIDAPTAEVEASRSAADDAPAVDPSDAQPVACANESGSGSGIEAGEREALRDCLDYHLARVSELSPAFASFVERAFDRELRSALPVAARDLLAAAEQSGRIEEREYTFDHIRYLICAVPTSMDGARDCFVDTYGGFTRLLAERLQADSFRADRCEILALLSFGRAESPWVSLTIVPDEGQDPRIDLLSYELLTEAERHEIEPTLDAEVSQSGLA